MLYLKYMVIIKLTKFLFSSLKDIQLKDSTKHINDYNVLQKNLNEDGYLLLRNFISKYDAEAIRKKISLKLWNVTESSSSLIGEQDPRSRDISLNYNDAYSLECIHNIWHNSKIKSFFNKLFKTEILMHPMVILRNSYKNTYTSAHQDWPQIQGAKDGIGIWIPLHDLEKNSGRLEIAENSHKEGVRQHKPDNFTGGMALDDDQFKWLSTNMNAGDAIIFSTFTVHRTEKNTSDTVRQSIDARFQSRNSPVCIRSLEPFIKDKWENIYKNWNDKTNARYWESYTLNIEEYDSYFEIINAIQVMKNFSQDRDKWQYAVNKIIARSSSQQIKELAKSLIKNND